MNVSDKLHFIDEKEFNKIRNNDVGSTKPPAIRNSKYKKIQKRTQFTLLDFVKVKQPKCKRNLRPRRVLINKPAIKRHGKTREGGKKRKLTRLKKSILSYRQQKRQEENKDQQNELEIGMRGLTLHSRRFRDYCENCTTKRLDELTEQLLRDLNRFQKRAYAQNEIKARARRRFVVGFRETQNFLKINKVKLVIIAPDCEQSKGEVGLDELIANIKEHCKQHQVPYVFSLRRRKLAYVLYKKVPISCVAILDYDGANASYADLLEALKEARLEYTKLS